MLYFGGLPTGPVVFLGRPQEQLYSLERMQNVSFRSACNMERDNSTQNVELSQHVFF